jgi:GNAT superfamily N-acetyltransferase
LQRAVTEPGNPASEGPPAIRWATVEDAHAIAALHIASWHAAYRGLMPDEVLDALTIAKRERDWQGWLADGGERVHTLVVEREGEIEAFCTLELPSKEKDESDTVAGIPAIYAHPSAFGRGAGPALLDEAIDAMRGRGYGQAILWMLEGNRRAEAFYERLGWHRDGGRRAARYPGITFEAGVEPIEIRYRRSLEAAPS